MWILIEVDEPHDVGKDELQRILIYDITIDVAPLVSDLHIVAEGHAVHPATPSDMNLSPLSETSKIIGVV